MEEKKYIKDLTDRDFYEQACAYFYYHAEQRTTMINYFIAVFAACLALYGSLIKEYPFASLLISGFLFVVARLFYSIDIRNRFDVKHSQSVITQIERDYWMDTLRGGDATHVYGVFSNEDNIFKYYSREKRRKNKAYKDLRRLHIEKKLKKRLRWDKTKLDALEDKFKKDKAKILKNVETVSDEEFMCSLDSWSITSLSNSIKHLYRLCMGISILGFVFAGVITFVPEILEKIMEFVL